ncbi:hypothetical protein M9H77_17719 [Catharanthus roseus]|uniref:Uncharacterized protein n=2 Tax=Catharanthus roseus TaxID=4058 RepID=A0ACC0B5F8_CATRO|nr:hypothetical protein M9H77_17718 [Catharanthus roseus]KAI5667866.1 hypothetical protein M9H77_17719 [Catharanthus roseus]
MTGFMKTSLPYSRGIATKPQVSTYKGCPKKNDTPTAPFKDNPKPKIAIKCPTKRILIFCEDLNGWIEKDQEDCLEDLVVENDSHDDEDYIWAENMGGLEYAFIGLKFGT